jgi:hypothetical protein
VSERPRWRRYDDPEPKPLDGPALADAWMAEFSYDQAHPEAVDADCPEDDDWMSPKERVWSLVSEDRDEAWTVALLLLERVPDEALWEVGHEVVRDIVRVGWPGFMPTVEAEARRNARLRAALFEAICCSSFAQEILQRIGALKEPTR